MGKKWSTKMTPTEFLNRLHEATDREDTIQSSESMPYFTMELYEPGIQHPTAKAKGKIKKQADGYEIKLINPDTERFYVFGAITAVLFGWLTKNAGASVANPVVAASADFAYHIHPKMIALIDEILE